MEAVVTIYNAAFLDNNRFKQTRFDHGYSKDWARLLSLADPLAIPCLAANQISSDCAGTGESRFEGMLD